MQSFISGPIKTVRGRRVYIALDLYANTKHSDVTVVGRRIFKRKNAYVND